MAGSSSSTCYYPNGDPSKQKDIPCSNSDACCPEGWSCEDTGLCYLANEQYYGRYTCTDKSWQSSKCPQICTQDKTATGNEAILECSTGSYCCDANRPELSGGQACCDSTKDRFAIRNFASMDSSGGSGSGGGGSSPKSSSTPGPSSSPTTSEDNSEDDSTTSPTPRPSSSSGDRATSPGNNPTQTPSSSPSSVSTEANNSPTGSSTSVVVVTSVISKSDNSGPSTLVTSASSVVPAAPVSSSSAAPAPSSKSSNNIGAIVGPAVAVPVALIALAALAFFVIRRRRRNRTNVPLSQPDNLEPMYHENKPPVDLPYDGKQELEGSPGTPYTPIFPPGHPDHQTSEDAGVASTAPPSYRGIPSINQTPNPNVSPVVGSNRDSRSSELASSPSTKASTRRSELPGNPTIDEATEGMHNPSELPGSTYHAYRPPGWKPR